jgi:hypothetical protein
VISTFGRCRDFHRLIAAAMAEFQFVRFGPDRPAEQLMAQADAEDRDFADRPFDRLDRVIQHGRIARAVADEQPVGPMLENFLGGHIRRKDRDLDAALAEMPQDILLGAAIQRDDVQPIAALDFPIANRPGPDPIPIASCGLTACTQSAPPLRRRLARLFDQPHRPRSPC